MTVWGARASRDTRFLCGWRVDGRATCDAELGRLWVVVDNDGNEMAREIGIPTYYLQATSTERDRFTLPAHVREKIRRKQRPRSRRGPPIAVIERYGFERTGRPPVEIECPRHASHGFSLIDSALMAGMSPTMPPRRSHAV